MALVVAGIAVTNAVVGLLQRWCSSKIGEGLIYNLRTAVFDHVSGMPIAFFTRTQTGKLVSRLNSDVIGAQRAFTSTLSGAVSNIFGLILTLAAMLALSWQLTVGALVLLPVFVIPARMVGRKLADLTRQQMSDNAEMSATMTERFSVSGALLVKLFGRPTEEHDRFAVHTRGGVEGCLQATRFAQTDFLVILAVVIKNPAAVAAHRVRTRRVSVVV
ncbi:hypothetical protein SDC9_181115 [bioreactor metagenome]|uniref:ABC transmembrane type-1 domain-containing protein n=1 Tax=bioreactor metagenome TaxID=1076179 RepID=A0A645H567_9ZZZZ